MKKLLKNCIDCSKQKTITKSRSYAIFILFGSLLLLIMNVLVFDYIKEIYASAENASVPLVFQSSMNYGGNKDDSFKGIANTKDGGFVAVGYSLGASENPSWNHNGNAKSVIDDPIVVKFDKNHNVEWTKNYGTEFNDIFFDVAVTTSGDIIAVGKSKSKGFIVRINPSNPDDYKKKTTDGLGGASFEKVVATKDGGYAVVGWSAERNSSMFRERNSITSRDAVIVKCDNNNNIQFAKCFNYGKNLGLKELKKADFFGVAEDNNGDLIAVGDFQVAANLYNSQIYKIDGKNGKELWSKSVGSKLKEKPNDKVDYHTSSFSDVEVLKDGSYLVIGTAKNDATTEENWTTRGVVDSIVIRYSSSGKLLKTNIVGGIGRSINLNGILPTDDGGYLVYGSEDGKILESDANENGFTWDNNGATDMLFIKYNSNNAVSWSKNYGGENADYVNDVIKTSDGGITIVGESTGPSNRRAPIWKNNGKVDALVLATNKYKAAETVAEKEDKNVVYEDGEFVDLANGYDGDIKVKLTIEGGKISRLEEVSQQETKSYYNRAKVVYERIINANSVNVDGVTGATLSSNGIKNATKKALSQSAAKKVVNEIEKLNQNSATYEADKNRVKEMYNNLGDYSRKFVTNADKLNVTPKNQPETSNEQSNQESNSQLQADVIQKDNSRTVKTANKSNNKSFKDKDTYIRLQNESYKYIGWSSFRDNKLTGKGTTIAIIDSGLVRSCEDIDYSKITKRVDFTGNKEIETDQIGHGTAVTGIIQAKSDNKKGVSGILSEANILELKVEGSKNRSDDIAKAIRYAADTKADVINISIGVDVDKKDLKEAIEYAASKNIIIIAAAGNDGTKAYKYPAAYPQVIGVGAVDSTNTVRASSQKNDSVFVVAPGDNVVVLDLSRKSKCKISSGTSFSAPIVSSMAVVAKSQNHDITDEQFRQDLIKTSTDCGIPGYDFEYGYGVVNIKKFASLYKKTGIGSKNTKANKNSKNTTKTENNKNIESNSSKAKDSVEFGKDSSKENNKQNYGINSKENDSSDKDKKDENERKSKDSSKSHQSFIEKTLKITTIPKYVNPKFSKKILKIGTIVIGILLSVSFIFVFSKKFLTKIK